MMKFPQKPLLVMHDEASDEYFIEHTEIPDTAYFAKQLANIELEEASRDDKINVVYYSGNQKQLTILRNRSSKHIAMEAKKAKQAAREANGDKREYQQPREERASWGNNSNGYKG